jgi:hypothetical protein
MESLPHAGPAAMVECSERPAEYVHVWNFVASGRDGREGSGDSSDLYIQP